MKRVKFQLHVSPDSLLPDQNGKWSKIEDENWQVLFFITKKERMRKVVVSMNVTIDGFMSGPDCELDWHFQSWTEEMSECLCEQLSRADTILLGRVTYGAMARYWPSQAMNSAYPREDIAFAEMMNNYPKIVFSKTLTTAGWNNSRLVKGNILNEISQLKQMPGKDIIIYGSGRIVSALAQLNLIDEYVLWVHPVILGEGRPLFRLHSKRNLELIKTRTFKTGVVILYYQQLKAV